jgi:hypothetical protein
MTAVPNFLTGRKSSIGTTALQLTTNTTKADRGVQITAGAGNSAIIYVGLHNVTADSADDTDGFPLAAGESILVPVRDATKVYVVASTGTNSKVFFMLV